MVVNSLLHVTPLRPTPVFIHIVTKSETRPNNSEDGGKGVSKNYKIEYNLLVCILTLTILESFYDDWWFVLGAFTNTSVGSNTASVCIVRV